MSACTGTTSLWQSGPDTDATLIAPPCPTYSENGEFRSDPTSTRSLARASAVKAPIGRMFLFTQPSGSMRHDEAGIDYGRHRPGRGVSVAAAAEPGLRGLWAAAPFGIGGRCGWAAALA